MYHHRQTAMGFCTMVAGFGGISASYIALYLPMVHSQLPMIVLGSSSLLGALLALLLPETAGSKLPETVEDIKELKNKSKPLCQCFKLSKSYDL